MLYQLSYVRAAGILAGQAIIALSADASPRNSISVRRLERGDAAIVAALRDGVDLGGDGRDA
jgi:hypothetical protein